MNSYYDRFATQGKTSRGKSFYDQFTPPQNATTGKRKGKSFYDTFEQEPPASDYLQRVANTNANKLADLEQTGQLQDFQRYQESPSMAGRAWNNIKQFGSGALDVLQRGEYATAGISDELYGGGTMGDAAKRVGRELFSGIGNIQGEKESFGDVLRQHEPLYEEFSRDHPWVSIGTDLAMGIALDPTTYIPAGAIAKGGKKLANAADTALAPIKATQTYQDVAGTLGRTFDPKYLWKKAGAEAGYDIVWGEGKFAHNYANKVHKRLAPAVDELATWEPEKIKDFVRVMYPLENETAAEYAVRFKQAAPDVQATAKTIKDELRFVGRKESRYRTPLGAKDAEGNLIDRFGWMTENYLPNNPKQLTDLMEMGGDYTPSGHMRGLAEWKKTFEREKVLRTGDDFLSWLAEKGVSDDDLAEVVTRNLRGRVNQSAGRIRQIRIHNKWTKELPDTFRELPTGKYKSWSSALEKGETPWMPAGNLRFFSHSKWDSLPADVRELLERGGQLTEDMAAKLDKEILGVSSKVKVYAVPSEVVEDITRVSTRMGNPDSIAKYWDGVINIFKNTAILSPFFHVRNFISSGSQNYLADMRPARYRDALRVLTATDDTQQVLGKSVSAWRELMGRWGITSGSFVGQDIKKTGVPLFEGLFKANRKMGSIVENVNRAPLFMDGIAKGMSPLEAAKRVKKFHFDYSELTDVESKFFRRAMPFYTWCVSEDTECLTRNGWKLHGDVNIGDEILTYNIDNKCYEWKPVQDKYEGQYNYRLMHFVGKSMDLLCTFDHKCVTSQNGLRPAYQVSQRNTTPTKIKYMCDDYPIPDRTLKLISWIVTDGYSRMRKNSLECVIYQKKEPYLAEIKKLVGDDGTEYVHPETGTSCVRINGKTRKDIAKHFTDKEKIWDLFVRLSPRQMRIAQAEMMKAEGCCSYKGENKEFSHFAQENAHIKDVFQLITILSGTASTISKRGVYIRTKPTVKYPKPKTVDYNGMIWCPTTENGTWVARRNGKVIVTGNTRKNVPLQLEMLFKAPKKYRNIAKLKEAIAGMPETQNNPEWWKEQDVWQTKFTDDQGDRYGVMVGLPYSDLNQFARNPMGMTGPLGVAINTSYNYNPFYGDKISKFAGEKKFGLPAQAQYALSGIVPIFKRYGFDMIEDVPEMAKFIKGEEYDFNKAFRGLSKFVGTRLLKSTKTQRERTEIYKLMNDLRDYEKYQQQQATGARQ